MLSPIQILLLLLLGYIGLYSIINRICTTIEHCAAAKAFASLQSHGIQTTPETLAKMIDKVKSCWDSENTQKQE